MILKKHTQMMNYFEILMIMWNGGNLRINKCILMFTMNVFNSNIKKTKPQEWK